MNIVIRSDLYISIPEAFLLSISFSIKNTMSKKKKKERKLRKGVAEKVHEFLLDDKETF